MQRLMRIWGVALITAGFGGGGVASAQDDYTFAASLAGGFAGAFDSDARDFDYPAFQGAFGMFTDERTLTVVRIGRIAFDSHQTFAGLVDAELDYANIAGEYRFRQAAYDFGLFVGVGAYRLQGEAGGGQDEETAIGAAVGFTGDFDLTRRVSLVAELDFHYVFLDEFNLYGAALAGVAIHF